VSEEIYRRVMELALLGELRHPCSLPPLENSSPRSPDNAQSARPAAMIP
jgi:hypothetical protein